MRMVLLLGRRESVVEDIETQLRLPDVQFLGGTGIEDLRSAFAQGNVDDVIMGAGLDLDIRLQMVREISSSAKPRTST